MRSNVSDYTSTILANYARSTLNYIRTHIHTSQWGVCAGGDFVGWGVRWGWQRGVAGWDYLAHVIAKCVLCEKLWRCLYYNVAHIISSGVVVIAWCVIWIQFVRAMCDVCMHICVDNGGNLCAYHSYIVCFVCLALCVCRNSANNLTHFMWTAYSELCDASSRVCLWVRQACAFSHVNMIIKRSISMISWWLVLGDD